MNDKSNIFNGIISTIESDDIRDFAEVLLDTIPDYFWDVGASSTGKYHPQYALGDLGLARHTCALVRIMNHLFSIDCVKNDFTKRERDLLRLAGIMHDTRKSGSQKDYLKNKYTKFDHPLQAANIIREYKDVYLSNDEIEFVASVIESHMGQWNTDKRSDIVLPTPTNKYQKILHICDYLASRKDLEILFDPEFTAEKPSLKNYVMEFGKYKGEKLIDLAKNDSDYVRWLKENVNREPIQSLLMQLDE